jgi:hypothetical protein
MSDAVESVYLYPAGVAIEFRMPSLTQVLSDVDRALRSSGVGVDGLSLRGFPASVPLL